MGFTLPQILVSTVVFTRDKSERETFSHHHHHRTCSNSIRTCWQFKHSSNKIYASPPANKKQPFVGFEKVNHPGNTLALACIFRCQKVESDGGGNIKFCTNISLFTGILYKHGFIHFAQFKYTPTPGFVSFSRQSLATFTENFQS